MILKKAYRSLQRVRENDGRRPEEYVDWLKTKLPDEFTKILERMAIRLISIISFPDQSDPS